MHNKIASLRKAWALSQAELGQLIGRSRNGVGHMEMGARHYSLEVALRLSALFDADIADIFPDHARAGIEALAARLAPLSIQLEGREGLVAERKRELLASFSSRYGVADVGI